MRLRLKAGLAALLVALTAGLATAGPAAAITGGEADGNGHPNVGLILFYSPDGRFRCSATLVTPDRAPDGRALHRRTRVGKTLVDFRLRRSARRSRRAAIPVGSQPGDRLHRR